MLAPQILSQGESADIWPAAHIPSLTDIFSQIRFEDIRPLTNDVESYRAFVERLLYYNYLFTRYLNRPRIFDVGPSVQHASPVSPVGSEQRQVEGPGSDEAGDREDVNEEAQDSNSELPPSISPPGDYPSESELLEIRRGLQDLLDAIREDRSARSGSAQDRPHSA